jgi:MFS family permease
VASAGLYRWYVLALMTLVYAVNMADRVLVSTMLEPIKAELHLSDSAAGFLTGAALGVFHVTLSIPLALLADRWSRKRIIAISLVAWSAATSLCGMAASFVQLAVCRVLVGSGEAGATPASQSLLADLFDARRRVVAASVFATGAAIGSAIGTGIAGLVADFFGWRYVFYFFGIPGVLLAVIVALTVREPRRGVIDSTQARAPVKAPLVEIVRCMWRQPTLRHVVLGGTAITFWSWGLLWWTPAFFERSHGMTTREIGTYLGTLHLVIGTLVVLSAGTVVHRLAKRDIRWECWAVAVLALVTTVPTVWMFVSPSRDVSLMALWLFVPALYAYIGPIFGLTQNLLVPEMRATGIAILLFLANLTSSVIAPQLVGFLSDWTQANTQLGAHSLGAVLAVFALFGLWPAWHFLRAARTLRADAEHVASQIRAPSAGTASVAAAPLMAG